MPNHWSEIKFKANTDKNKVSKQVDNLRRQEITQLMREIRTRDCCTTQVIKIKLIKADVMISNTFTQAKGEELQRIRDWLIANIGE